MNETGFRVSYRIIYYIIILDKSKSLRFINSNNRNYVIFVEYISTIDWSIFLFVILKGVYILYK